MSFFGEGATSKGDFHEALNFAGIHQLPMVFVCENNGYAISVPMSAESAVDDVADRAHAYGFGGVIVDGNDPLDVYAAVHSAVRHARRGDGPDARRVQDLPLPRPHLRRRRPHLPHAAGGRGLAEEGPAPPDQAVPHRAAPPVGGRRGAHRGRGEGRGRRRPPRRPRRRPAPEPDDGLHARCSPTRCGPPRARPTGASDPSARAGRDAAARGRHRAQHRRHGPLDAARAPRRRRPRRDPRRGRRARAAACSAPPTSWPRSSAGDRVLDTPLAESLDHRHRDRPGARRAATDRRDPVRRLHPLRLRPARVARRPASTTAATATSRCRSWCGRRGAAACTARSTTRSPSRRPTRTSPGSRSWSRRRRPTCAGCSATAIDDPDPVLFLEHKKTYRLITGLVPDDDCWRVPIGVAEVAREGDDLTVVTYGLHRHLCLEAADAVAESDGASVEVVDLRTISPLDRDTVLASVAKTGPLPRRPRGQHQLRRRRRGGRHRGRGGVLRPRRAGAPAGHRRRAELSRSPAPSRPSSSSTPPRSSTRSAPASGD